MKDFNDYGVLIGEIITFFSDSDYPINCALGQSTGAAALSNYVLAQKGCELEKLVFYAPLLRTKG